MGLKVLAGMAIVPFMVVLFAVLVVAALIGIASRVPGLWRG